jgi:hypothetical protein
MTARKHGSGNASGTRGAATIKIGGKAPERMDKAVEWIVKGAVSQNSVSTETIDI